MVDGISFLFFNENNIKIMSSFTKLSDSRVTINGTKLKNNLPFVSSGIPSLDHVVGGGIPAGSVFAVEEDVLGNYSRILFKYFLAEGVTCKHSLFVISADENPKEIVKELPQPCTSSQDDEVNTTTAGIDTMKIAWRYEGLTPVESSFGSNSSFGHHFDLSKHIDEETINNSSISYYDLSINVNEDKRVGFNNPIYHRLLFKIKDAVSKDEFRSRSKDSKILRIGIHSLGSPTWLGFNCDDQNSNFGQDLLKFIFCLRVVVRDTNAVVFVTIPSHLFEEEHIINRILYSVDNAVKIESFAGSSRETNPVFKDYHGLFHVTKLSALYSLVPYVPPSLDLAFKLKRKKFLIEKLHLPPELEESSEREQDDITAVPQVNCGGFKKKDIDF